MVLYISLDVSFDSMQDWEGIQKKEEEVNSTKVHIADDGTSVTFSVNAILA
jgi:hypothetical protein